MDLQVTLKEMIAGQHKVLAAVEDVTKMLERLEDQLDRLSAEIGSSGYQH